MIESLDREARRLGVTRQSIIKVWIAERLESGRTAATFALLDSQLSWRNKVAMSEQIHSSAMSPSAMR
jgi:hypothetical protein